MQPRGAYCENHFKKPSSLGGLPDTPLEFVPRSCAVPEAPQGRRPAAPQPRATGPLYRPPALREALSASAGAVTPQTPAHGRRVTPTLHACPTDRLTFPHRAGARARSTSAYPRPDPRCPRGPQPPASARGAQAALATGIRRGP